MRLLYLASASSKAYPFRDEGGSVVFVRCVAELTLRVDWMFVLTTADTVSTTLPLHRTNTHRFPNAWMAKRHKRRMDDRMVDFPSTTSGRLSDFVAKMV